VRFSAHFSTSGAKVAGAETVVLVDWKIAKSKILADFDGNSLPRASLNVTVHSRERRSETMLITKSRIVCAVAAVVLAGCGGGDVSDPNAGAEMLENGMTVKAQIEARQDGYKAIGRNFKAINDQLKTDAPDLEAIQGAAAAMAEASAGMADWYPAGTGPESGVKTEALAVIWEDPDDFSAKISDYEIALAALQAATATGDFAAIGAAAQATGPTCGACHDKFRLDD
jgi:cytochrome c556